MGGVSHPLLSDFHPKDTLRSYGIYNEDSGVGRRSVFIIDKEGTIRWKEIYEPGTLPDATVILGELEKLQG